MDTNQIGGWLISLVTKLVGAAMTRQQVDPTVPRYPVNFITVALNIILVVAILGGAGFPVATRPVQVYPV